MTEQSGYIEKARLRVRSVKYKDGRGELRLLRPHRRAEHDDLISMLRRDANGLNEGDYAGQLAGYALVAWTHSNSTRYVSIRKMSDNPLWMSDIPDYVRNALAVYAARSNIEIDEDYENGEG